MVSPLFVSSTKASTVRCVEERSGLTNLIPGVHWSIARVIRSMTLVQLGGYQPVPCPVLWRGSYGVE